MTERDMLDALHLRYSNHRKGTRQYVLAEHVRSTTGRSRGLLRTADLIAQDCWKPMDLIGHEVKVSRSDWLTELRTPVKADSIKRYCDYWWLVAADKNIVKDDLPDEWGLMAVTKRGLTVIRQAPRLEPVPATPGFRAALLRAVAKTAERRGL